MTEAAAGGQPQSIRGVIATAVVTIVVGTLLRVLKVPDEVVTQAVAVAGAATGIVLLRVGVRRAGRAREIAALSVGEIVRPAALVTAILAFSLLFVESAIFGIIGFIVGTTAADIDYAAYGYGQSTIYVGIPLTLLATFLVARRASHYLPRNAILWLLAATALYFALRAILVLIIGDSTAFGDIDQAAVLLGAAVLAVIMFGVSVIGWWVSRRSHLEFVAARLFRVLSDGDKKAALSILQEAGNRGDPGAEAAG